MTDRQNRQKADAVTGQPSGPTRRGFLAAGSALVIGVCLPEFARADQRSGAAKFFNQTPDGDSAFVPNAFVRVAPDNTVTVLVKHIEFGQGPYTGLTTLVAEELDADWSQMRAAAAPSNVKLYANLAFGVQGTGGSTAMTNSYTQMRKAGAAAKAMLVAAAAAKFGVQANTLTVEKGVVHHKKSRRKATFGELAAAAAKVKPPVDPPLKKAKDFRLIGKDVQRVDSAAKSDGSAEFTMDVYRDGMVTAVVAHPPLFGATYKSHDASETMKVKGVRKVAVVPQGVAVYADDTWAALQGRAALKVEWNTTKAEKRSTVQLTKAFEKAAQGDGKKVVQKGDTKAALAKAAEKFEATYVFPYLAHTPMEPLDAVVELRKGEAEVWMGSQLQTIDHGMLAGKLGLPPQKIRLHTMLAGGSFGRRATGDAHFAAEAADVAKTRGSGATKLIWTREDDIKGGYYRPLTVHRVTAAVEKDGSISAWDHTIACQSIMAGTPFEAMMKDGLDPSAYEGAADDVPYAIANHRLGWARMESPIPVLWWRSVGHTHTGYVVETVIDELMQKAGKDRIKGRLALMGPKFAREKAVLKRVADMANWAGPGKGDSRFGVAVVKSFNSYVAQIVEVESRGGAPRVKKVWCAVDCGVPVNPDVIKAQMEGGIGYALGSNLYNEITLDDGGEVQQANWDSYRMLRLPEMPDIEVSIVPSTKNPTGVGEPGVPPLAAAVANAWRDLTGSAPRRLPMVRPEV